MSAAFARVPYAGLNSRQKENYNVHKVAARLADHGYTSMRLTDDFEGAEFVALHVDGETMLRVRINGRMRLDRKVRGRGIHVALRTGRRVFPSQDGEGRRVDPSLRDEAALRDGPRAPAWAVAALGACEA